MDMTDAPPERNSPPSSTLRVVGIAGSLRRGSYNRALLNAAQELEPDGMHIEAFDLGTLPLLNQDLDGEHLPAPVRVWRETLWAADALLIATPEYNYSVPGVLKNALDWASRPPQHQPLRGLPVAIMGATPSMWGTARGQAQLRQTLVYPNARLMSQPEVMIAGAHQKFSAEGRLTDSETRVFVRELLEAFLAWAQHVGRAAIRN
jgi:chromate reductase, NAD(P)H dehydrogenase (quinone)